MTDLIGLFIACGVATFATRAGGHVILSRFGTIHHRVEAALDAVPVAVISALVAPAIISNGWAETIAVVFAGFVATRLSMTFTVALGLLALVGLRFVMG